MDAQVTDSDILRVPLHGWLARERDSGRLFTWAMIGTAIALVAIVAYSIFLLTRPAAVAACCPTADRAADDRQPHPVDRADGAWSPSARDRAISRAIGPGDSTRLVALFSVLRSATVIVAIFSSCVSSRLDSGFRIGEGNDREHSRIAHRVMS